MVELHKSQHKETLQPAAPRELYREKIGFHDYVITDEEPEVIEKWKIEIEQLRDAISRRDLESLDALAMSEDFKINGRGAQFQKSSRAVPLFFLRLSRKKASQAV